MDRTSRFSILILFFALFEVISAVIRTVLLVKAWPGLDGSAWLLLKIYGTGLLFDGITFSYIAAVGALALTFLPDTLARSTVHRVLVHGLVFLFIYLLAFDAVAEYLFFDEFGTRFNFIAIDYLVYTREVLANIRESYPLGRILLGIFAVTCGVYVLVRNQISRGFRDPQFFRQRLTAGIAIAALPVLSFAFVNQSLTVVSRNAYANELAGNGLYNLVAAFRSSELDYQAFYPTTSDRVAFARLQELVRAPNNRYVHPGSRDLQREIRGRGAEQRRNVIVIVEESLSAEYLGTFGNRQGLTPNLDRLAAESLLFTRMYASGTRTVRGLEAITLSLPPLPGESIVKRPDNGGFFSWGSVMRSKGYDTKFLYAGYGYFDNMNAFFSRNGFAIIDRSDFGKDEITFANAWGVCDEDLFRKVISDADRSFAAGKRFFNMVMTTSNHRPFTYPGGKIGIASGTGRSGGVQYADYAIGRFIEGAKTRPWFKDTVFVIVADHCAGSAGKTELPVKRYEIPLIIYAPTLVRPGRVDTLASQIDVAPTVLGLLDFTYRTQFFGKDILRMTPADGRAFLSTYVKLGYLKGNTLTVAGPKRSLACYAVDRANGGVRSMPTAECPVLDLESYYQGASTLYKSRLNRIEEKKGNLSPSS